MTISVFDQLRDAVRECTSYDLDDVFDFIINNEQVEAYLSALN